MKRILAQFEYLNELNPDEIEAISSYIVSISIPAQQFIFHLSDHTESLYFLISGVVKMTYGNPRGDEAPTGFFQSGDIFGHLFLGKYHFRVGSAITLTDCHIGRLSQTDLTHIVDRYPHVGMAFLRLMSDYHRETLARLHALMHVNARARLLGALLNFARHWCCHHQGWFQMPVSLTQADIASMAGLNRTTANLLINDLRREGILGGHGRTLTVHLDAVRAILESEGLEILE